MLRTVSAFTRSLMGLVLPKRGLHPHDIAMIEIYSPGSITEDYITQCGLSGENKVQLRSALEKIRALSTPLVDPPMLRFERISDGSIYTPQAATSGSAAYDISPSDNVAIAPGKTAIVKTGLKVYIPQNYAGLLCGRSGLATKRINVHYGIIDSDYRGELGVIVYNNSDTVYEARPIDRIAQFMVVSILPPANTANVVRGEGGFGSTGK